MGRKNEMNFSKTLRVMYLMRHVVIKQELMSMKILFNVLVIFGFLFVTGCQPAAIPTGDTVTSPTAENNGGVDMSTPTLNPDPNAQRMTQLAKESMAKKFKVSEDQVHLSSVEAMIWPDASLGCPRAGEIYAQVLTPGFQILFEANGQSASYHTDDTSRVILCLIHPVDNIFLTP